jgi:hypothetical protein
LTSLETPVANSASRGSGATTVELATKQVKLLSRDTAPRYTLPHTHRLYKLRSNLQKKLRHRLPPLSPKLSVATLPKGQDMPNSQTEQPNWTTIPEKSTVPTPGFDTLIIPSQQVLQGPVHSGNPYIQQSRLFDGQLFIILLHPSVSDYPFRDCRESLLTKPYPEPTSPQF